MIRSEGELGTIVAELDAVPSLSSRAKDKGAACALDVRQNGGVFLYALLGGGRTLL